MPTLALMTKLALAEAKKPSPRADHGRRWMAPVHATCPGDAMAAWASLTAFALGTSATEPWTLIPCDRYLNVTRSH